MLKRFLKFLKGDDSTIVERFEGSYLDHLLEQVHPIVSEQLEECPEHDPLLLVVAAILRHTMMNVWDPRTTAPLLDSQSPGVPEGFTAPAAETAEFEAYNDDETMQFDVDGPLRDTMEIDAVAVELSESDETIDLDVTEDPAEPDAQHVEDETLDELPPVAASETESHDESADPGTDEDRPDDHDDASKVRSDEELVDEPSDASDDEPPAAPAENRARITEEIDVAEIRASAESVGHDVTLELDREALLEKNDDGDMRRPRVDTEDVLQAGRLYLGMLIENDRLPTDLQLSVAETMLARDMLIGYFIGSEEVADNAHRILALVEEKFREGLFGQARILLELFHTDERTWVDEEHKIFYEDMILKLGIRRRNRLSESEVAAFHSHIERSTDDDGVSNFVSWLGKQCLVSFHLYLRDPSRVEAWDNALKPARRAGARDNFNLYVPPRRWRPVDSYDTLAPTKQIARHVGPETARTYVLSHLKTCFVVLRAHGDTGLENYLDAFFDWTERVLDFNATSIMPEMYRRSMMDSEAMEYILESTYETYFEDLVDARVEGIEQNEVEAALFAAIANLRDSDIADVAPGYYDLGGFVFDELLEFRPPDPQFPFKIHRLS